MLTQHHGPSSTALTAGALLPDEMQRAVSVHYGGVNRREAEHGKGTKERKRKGENKKEGALENKQGKAGDVGGGKETSLSISEKGRRDRISKGERERLNRKQTHKQVKEKEREDKA